MDKQDFLRECMQGFTNVPIDEFNKAYCQVCLNSECSRSTSASAFNARVSNWEERLFINPDRADDDDPKFAHIRAKHFVSAEPGPKKIYSGPSFEEVKPKPEPTPEKQVAPPHPDLEITESIPEPPPSPAEPSPIITPVTAPIITPAPAPAPTTQVSPPTNTDFEQGKVIGDGNKDIVIDPGGTYTFGSEE